MDDVFISSFGCCYADDGPPRMTIYTPEITEEEVSKILFESRIYEIFGKIYEIRELTSE
jgi:hypothetical protein